MKIEISPTKVGLGATEIRDERTRLLMDAYHMESHFQLSFEPLKIISKKNSSNNNNNIDFSYMVKHTILF